MRQCFDPPTCLVVVSGQISHDHTRRYRSCGKLCAVEQQHQPSSPPQPRDVSDLLAVAVVRRLLMELGYHLDPDQVGRHKEIGPIEMWLHERRADLEGEAPITVLRTRGGEDRIRESLRHILSSSPGR